MFYPNLPQTRGVLLSDWLKRTVVRRAHRVGDGGTVDGSGARRRGGGERGGGRGGGVLGRHRLVGMLRLRGFGRGIVSLRRVAGAACPGDPAGSRRDGGRRGSWGVGCGLELERDGRLHGDWGAGCGGLRLELEDCCGDAIFDGDEDRAVDDPDGELGLDLHWTTAAATPSATARGTSRLAMLPATRTASSASNLRWSSAGSRAPPDVSVGVRASISSCLTRGVWLHPCMTTRFFFFVFFFFLPVVPSDAGAPPELSVGVLLSLSWDSGRGTAPNPSPNLKMPKTDSAGAGAPPTFSVGVLNSLNGFPSAVQNTECSHRLLVALTALTLPRAR